MCCASMKHEQCQMGPMTEYTLHAMAVWVLLKLPAEYHQFCIQKEYHNGASYYYRLVLSHLYQQCTRESILHMFQYGLQ